MLLVEWLADRPITIARRTIDHDDHPGRNLSVGPLSSTTSRNARPDSLTCSRAEADFDALAFDPAAARAFGRVAAVLRRAGRKPAARAYDALIASVAIVPRTRCTPAIHRIAPASRSGPAPYRTRTAEAISAPQPASLRTAWEGRTVCRRMTARVGTRSLRAFTFGHVRQLGAAAARFLAALAALVPCSGLSSGSARPDAAGPDPCGTGRRSTRISRPAPPLSTHCPDGAEDQRPEPLEEELAPQLVEGSAVRLRLGLEPVSRARWNELAVTYRADPLIVTAAPCAAARQIAGTQGCRPSSKAAHWNASHTRCSCEGRSGRAGGSEPWVSAVGGRECGQRPGDLVDRPADVGGQAAHAVWFSVTQASGSAPHVRAGDASEQAQERPRWAAVRLCEADQERTASLPVAWTRPDGKTVRALLMRRRSRPVLGMFGPFGLGACGGRGMVQRYGRPGRSW
jgi:hypothetical protein